jgi:lipoprotein-anchoring transpeptidase ErfK/SrfK
MKTSPDRQMFLVLTAVLASAGILMAQGNPSTTSTGKRKESRKQKKAAELIQRQEAPKVSARLMEKLTPDQSRIVVSLGQQRAYLLNDAGEIVIDTPISSGKRAGMTSSGNFTISEKDADHRSNIYGNYVDRQGRVVRSGVSTRIDSAPSGTRFSGAPMAHFMRLTDFGVGMHEGILPGYPASHGCIRLPGDIAEMIFHKVKIGTPVTVSQ